MSTCLVQIRKEHKRMYAKEYINFKVAPQDVIIIPHFWVCARYLCSDKVLMWGHDLLAPTVTGYMLWWWYQLPVVSVESTSVVTLLHKESHDFRPLPSPQLSPSEMQVDWETMVAWLTWTHIENGLELLMTSYAEAVHESNSWGVCMQLCVHYLLYRASMFTMGWYLLAFSSPRV